MFNVTDRDGNKVLDDQTISYIQTVLVLFLIEIWGLN